MKYNTLHPIILNENRNKIFIETGFWRGYGIKVAIACGFEQLYSCDIDKSAIEIAEGMYGESHNVEVYHKQSVDYLEMLFQTNGMFDGITFWLDAHPGNAGHSPIIDELLIIAKYCKGKDNVIMIDDYAKLNSKWGIDIDKLYETIHMINPDFKIEVVPRIYCDSGDINDPTLPRKGELLVAKLQNRNMETDTQYPGLLMGKNEVEYIIDTLNEDDIMLEWGSGGSTYTFSSYVKKYCSIEHDAEWSAKVVSTLDDKGISNVELHHVGVHGDKTDVYLDSHAEHVFRHYESFKTEFGITYAQTAHGNGDWHHFIDYVNEIKSFDTKFDKIFIDGRVRPLCAFMALEYLKDDGLVFIHDFGKRPKYRSVLDHYKIVDEITGDWDGAMIVLQKL
jgi:hypothetical protein